MMFAVGDKVEARFGGRASWYPGEVTAISESGASYAVKYDDGDFEPAVKPELMRNRRGNKGSSKNGQSTMINERSTSSSLASTLPAPSAAAAFSSSSAPAQTPADGVEEAPSAIATYSVDQKVEARFGGKAKWYGAVVKEAHEDGTYALHYEDGDKESSVPEDFICPAAGPQLAGMFRIGQRVQGRFGGKNKFYDGAILRDQGDGTYAVKYDDGDIENAVRHVRALQGDAATAAGPDIDVSFSASAPAAVDPSAVGFGRVVEEEEEEEVTDDAEMRFENDTEASTRNSTTIDFTRTGAAETIGVTTAAIPTARELASTGYSSALPVDKASQKTSTESPRDEAALVGQNADGQGNPNKRDSNQVRENEIAPPSAFANAASVFDLNHDLDEDNPSSTSSSTNTKAAEASEHNEANAAATAAAATDAAYSDQKSSATNSNEVQPTSLLATVLGATSNNVAPATVSPPADPMAVPAVASPSCVLTTAAESAGAGPGSADAPLEAATSTNNEAAAATSAAAAVEEANKRAAKLAKAACSLVLLREAPTRWDVHRNQVHRSYAAEAIARGEEIVQLKRALARAQAAAAGRSNQDFHPHTADTARAGTGATAAAEEDTRVTAFTSHLPPPPTTSRIKVKSSLTPTPPRPPPTSARGRIVRFLVEKGGLTAGSSSSRSHSHVCSPEQCEAFFGCSDLETLAENADAKVAAAVSAGVLTSPEPASTVLRALRRYAMKQTAASNVLRLTFRCLYAFAKAEQRARAVEMEAEGARKRRDATEAECNQKVNALASKINRLERDLAETQSTLAAHKLSKRSSRKSTTASPVTLASTTAAATAATAAALTAASSAKHSASRASPSHGGPHLASGDESSATVKREMESLRSMLRRRDAQVDELGRRVAQQAGLANQVEALTKALTRATVRERTLERDLESAQKQLLAGLKDAQEEVASVKASCARRVTAADRSASQQASRADKSHEARLAGQARYGATLAARRRDDPSSAEAQPAIRAHHGLFA